ncbi:Abi-alpha family protein [Magnetospirillum aberrantis]|uniref:DUF4393 domain-containing protein n=1 Tax=Magnetospirillum aberrantis SpK TaxID=908842 RepID=A0A7C9QV40_9PROT|nr:Abi-alpha family protein [Magnetospirillum aberrantis]NFV81403.1 DUF4393 domain-containing protein [Magnetospirillum aberrantis SpK]
METKIDIKVGEEASANALSFVQRLIGPLAEASDFLSDKIRFYRWKSAIEVLNVASNIMSERGIIATEIPLKFLVPFLEKCSLGDADDGLREKWAHLLASTSDKYSINKHVFINILSEIDAPSVKILDDLYDTYWSRRSGKTPHAFYRDDFIQGGVYESYVHNMTLAAEEYFSSVEGADDLNETLIRLTKKDPSRITNIIDEIFRFININGRMAGEISFLWGVHNMKFGHKSTNPNAESIPFLQRAALVSLENVKFDLPDGPGGWPVWLEISWAELSPLGHEFVATCKGHAPTHI